MEYLNYWVYCNKEHQNSFDDKYLTEFLLMAGFKDVRVRVFDETLDTKYHEDHSIHIEAIK